jgi:hypothetical protein
MYGLVKKVYDSFQFRFVFLIGLLAGISVSFPAYFFASPISLSFTQSLFLPNHHEEVMAFLN